jgi:hypothetical protein
MNFTFFLVFSLFSPILYSDDFLGNCSSSLTSSSSGYSATMSKLGVKLNFATATTFYFLDFKIPLALTKVSKSSFSSSISLQVFSYSVSILFCDLSALYFSLCFYKWISLLLGFCSTSYAAYFSAQPLIIS